MSLKNPILRNGTLLEETRVGCVATEGAAGATDSRSSAPRPRSLWWRPKEMAARVSRQAFRARACGSLWSRERSPISVTSAILLRDRRPELQLGTDGFHKKKIPPAAGRFAMPVDQARGNVPNACVFVRAAAPRFSRGSRVTSRGARDGGVRVYARGARARRSLRRRVAQGGALRAQQAALVVVHPPARDVRDREKYRCARVRRLRDTRLLGVLLAFFLPLRFRRPRPVGGEKGSTDIRVLLLVL